MIVIGGLFTLIFIIAFSPEILYALACLFVVICVAAFLMYLLSAF